MWRCRIFACETVGVPAIPLAIVRGIIAELQLFSRARASSRQGRGGCFGMVWQASSIDRHAIGRLLIVVAGLAPGCPLLPGCDRRCHLWRCRHLQRRC